MHVNSWNNIFWHKSYYKNIWLITQIIVILPVVLVEGLNSDFMDCNASLEISLVVIMSALCTSTIGLWCESIKYQINHIKLYKWQSYNTKV